MSDITPTLNPTLTKAGLALMPNPNATGFVLTFTHVAIGTALYDSSLAATRDMVALRNEVARFPISSGTNPTDTSIQIGTTITDTDPNGKSPNGLAIGEIGFFAGATLVAVWSQLATPLFVKSANFDVPFAYTLDVSIFTANSVTVVVATDTVGMAAMILQHEAKADPHGQYVMKSRGMGEFDLKTIYNTGAKITGPDGKSYRSLVDNNVGNVPALFPLKWERWALSVAEMDLEFIPKRTVVQNGTADTTGILRVQSPAGGSYGKAGAVTGALKIAFPVASKGLDTYIRMSVEVLDLSTKGTFTVQLAGHFNTALGWEAYEVAILGQAAARDLNVRFGSDGTRACVWIGELASVWNSPRVFVTDVLVSLNATGGDGVLWASGWSVAPATAFGTVAFTSSGNLVFGQTDVAHVAGLAAALAAGQPVLGYTPVQQGGGIGQLANKVYLGHSAGGPKITIDSTDMGIIAFLNSPAFTGAPTVPVAAPGTNTAQIASTSFVQLTLSTALVGQIFFEPRTTPRAGYIKLNGAVLNRADYPGLWGYALSSGALVSDAQWLQGYNGCFSVGDNATTFRVPEIRGESIRVWDDSRGVDPGRAIGTFQNTSNLVHTHDASSSVAGSHAHTAGTDAQGYHSHTGNTGGVGDHQHISPFGDQNLAFPYGQTGANNLPGSHGGQDNDNNWPYTSPTGGHVHGIALDGLHGHNIGVNPAGDHNHVIYIGNTGDSESRPRNIALSAFIRAY